MLFQKVINAFIVAFVALLLFFCGNYLWDRLHPSKPISISQQQASNPKVIANILDSSGFVLSSEQSQSIAYKIKNPSKADYDGQLITTGKNIQQAIDTGKKKSKADAVIITDPQNPQKQPVVKPDDVVVLNQYNIKAYPKHLAEVTIWDDGIDVAYQARVKLPKIPVLLPRGAVGYAGPAIGVMDGKIRAGMRVTVTF